MCEVQQRLAQVEEDVRGMLCSIEAIQLNRITDEIKTLRGEVQFLAESIGQCTSKVELKLQSDA